MAAVLALNWYAMMAVHELGHVLGAWLSGGSVQRVVLHPLAISRTDVAPNPRPGVVAWMGPIIGCAATLLAYATAPQRRTVLRKLAGFFAGFCLIANGAYIAGGSLAGVGDAREMFRTGAPRWALLGFGAVTVPLGLVLWHRLGSLTHFLRDPALVTPRMTYAACAACVAAILAGYALSPQ